VRIKDKRYEKGNQENEKRVREIVTCDKGARDD
jgi:hypothetical protein